MRVDRFLGGRLVWNFCPKGTFEIFVCTNFPDSIQTYAQTHISNKPIQVRI